MMSKKIRVVFVSTDWGFCPYQALLIDSLRAQGLVVEVHPPKLLLIFQFLRRRPDIIHIQFLQHYLSTNIIYGWFRLVLFAIQAVLLRLMGVRIVWTVHEWFDKETDAGNYTPSPLQAKTAGIVLGAIITHCDSTKDTIIQASGLRQQSTQKIFTIPHHNYIDTYPNDIERDVARKQLGIREDETVFLLFGSIHRSKGVLRALDAFKKIEDNSTKLIITGEVPDNLREGILAKISHSKNVFLVDPPNPIPDKDIQIYMNASDVVILPYTVFTTSGVAVLAMSFKKACIAPRAGFFKDIFNSSGAFLYHPSTEGALSKAMETAIAHRKQLPEMGEYNFKACQAWSGDYITQKTIKTYRLTINRPLFPGFG